MRQQMLGGGGGHHGGHHHGGGGGFYPGWIGPSWYGQYPDSSVQVFTVDSPMPAPSACPKVRQPVLASDGLVYDNACFARAAGVKVVRPVAQAKSKTPMKGFGAFTVSVDDQNVTPGFWLGVAVGAIGTSILRAILR